MSTFPGAETVIMSGVGTLAKLADKSSWSSLVPSPTKMSVPTSAPGAAQVAMYKKLYPVDYLERHLSEKVREDGRALDEFRNASVATGILSHAQGSALVRLGAGTMVTAAVKAEIAKPHYLRPNEGYLVPSLDLSPLCSPQYKVGPPGEEAQALTHHLQMFLRDAGLLPRSSLCLEEGEWVWSLSVDVVCLSADGGLLEAAALAVVAALHNCRLPVVLRQSSGLVFDSKSTVPLEVQELPILTSFGLYDSTYLLADMTAFEQAQASGQVLLGITEGDDDIFWVKLEGQSEVVYPTALRGQALLEHCTDLSRQRAAHLRALIKDALRAQDTPTA